jgi:peptide alpha-N-acetyltransferase
MAIRQMVAAGCEEVVLEAVVTNTGALKLYQGLGFLRDKHLHRWGWAGARVGGLGALRWQG